ncbi:MAG: hypothetical protein ACOZHQ_00740, partial [Thermodesulfobacteriota bacterium]
MTADVYRIFQPRRGEQLGWALAVSLGVHLLLVAVLVFWRAWGPSKRELFAPVYQVQLVGAPALPPGPAAAPPAPAPAPPKPEPPGQPNRSLRLRPPGRQPLQGPQRRGRQEKPHRGPRRPCRSP